MEDDRFLTPAEVAEMLQVSMRTLDGYRRAGTGPQFHRFNNRVRYRQRDVVAWARTWKDGANTRPEGAGRGSGD